MSAGRRALIFAAIVLAAVGAACASGDLGLPLSPPVRVPCGLIRRQEVALHVGIEEREQPSVLDWFRISTWRIPTEHPARSDRTGAQRAASS